MYGKFNSYVLVSYFIWAGKNRYKWLVNIYVWVLYVWLRIYVHVLFLIDKFISYGLVRIDIDGW